MRRPVVRHTRIHVMDCRFLPSAILIKNALFVIQGRFANDVSVFGFFDKLSGKAHLGNTDVSAFNRSKHGFMRTMSKDWCMSGLPQCATVGAAVITAFRTTARALNRIAAMRTACWS